nr:hypothetical protein [Achromobacter animicus]
MPKHQAVPLELPQGQRQHTLRDAMHAPADLGMPQPSIHAERVDNTQRPAASSMCEYLSPQPIVIIPQAVTNGL